MDLSIIIVNFNTKKLTLDCINSIRNSKPKTKYEIIIIDNASTENFNIENLLKIKNLKLKIIHNNVNLGFAKANNQGIKASVGKFILLLNSDTKVKKDSIDALVNFAKDRQDVGVVGSKLLNPDGSIQSSVFRFPNISRAIAHYWLGQNILNKYAPVGDSPVEVEAVVGASFLIAPTAIKKVGLLDEKYFMYYEDIDYCLKVKNNGLKVYYLPASIVTHYHGGSGGKNEYLVSSSKIYHGLFSYYLITGIIKIKQMFSK